MAKELPGSKYGDGIGGPVQVTDDPNNPTFDVATHKSSSDKQILFLLSDAVLLSLSDWERDFLLNVYGVAPLSRKQHIRIYRIYQKHKTE